MSADPLGLVLDLCDRIERGVPGTAAAASALRIRERATGPLRVAIAGRIKAGKSTLLNALVGERVAATDAGECTRVVTVYERGDTYHVSGLLLDGRHRELRMHQRDGAWRIELGELVHADLERIDVRWPSSVLAATSFVDTPGLGSLDDASSRRSLDYLVERQDDPAGADAVIYLMRHLHALDAEFLGAFMDRRVVGASPVNSIAVLARPDEIGACRADAMQSARRIAARLANDPTVRALVGTVVPVAGLLAETAQTLRDHEYRALRVLAAMPADEVRRMLRSVDDFTDLAASDLTVEHRRELLGRLGLFGLRIALDALRDGSAASASELARALLDASGLDELRRLIRTTFLPRAQTLKARTALAALDALARSMTSDAPELARAVRTELERAEIRETGLAALRAAHLVTADVIRTDDAERREVATVLLAADGPVAAAMRVGGEAEILDAIDRWRRRGADPRAGGLVHEACDTMARVYELALAQLDQP